MLLKMTVVVLASLLLASNALASGTVAINAKELKSREQMLQKIAQQLNIPASHSKTLEGLYNYLSTDFTGRSIIKVKNLNLLRAKLGSDYIDDMVQVMIEASEENPRIVLLLEY